MAARTLVSISWCASHYKGRDPWEAPRMLGVEHAELSGYTVVDPETVPQQSSRGPAD